jgi:nitroimidazol reductase NimA-like FMN-containing flavoprotein (pyridoxamine 5'-phosphate oxidase superfamily)
MRATRPYMPGYGILPADEGEGLLPFEWAEARLRDARNYWVATVGPDGPHLMAVWGVWIDLQFVFSTGRKSRKARNLASNPRCVVAPEGAADEIVVEGAAREVAATDAFVEAYREKYDFDVTSLDEPVFAVTPAKVIALIEVEEHFAGTATRWIFGD